MKQTKADKDFAVRFAAALGPYVAGEREKGESLASIAKRLGISGPGLLKQLNGGTPSVRTIALAYTVFGISVPYAGVDVAKAVSSKRSRKAGPPYGSQLLLPFEITAPPSSQRLVLKLVPKSARRYHLQLMVKMSA
jgi:transcriptional regulator with XRE-family HTH domain